MCDISDDYNKVYMMYVIYIICIHNISDISDEYNMVYMCCYIGFCMRMCVKYNIHYIRYIRYKKHVIYST